MSKPIPLPPQELLQKLLRYDEKTGLIYWRERDITLVASLRALGRFNTLYANQEAVTGILKGGYKQTRIKGRIYLSHRLIWKLVYGEDPEYVDHIDGNPVNNRIQNLRSVSHIENNKNARIRHDNQSGKVGVSYDDRDRVWKAYISNKGKLLYLGSFLTVETAIQAREQAEQKYGYHPNHGRN